jgi:hypothetical protein
MVTPQHVNLIRIINFERQEIEVAFQRKVAAINIISQEDVLVSRRLSPRNVKQL